MLYRIFFLILCFLFQLGVSAQSPVSMTSSEILLAIQKLRVTGSVLYIAAHPDDENTRLLAYLAKGRLYRTGYLSITRGDGGQNLIGEEQGVELGLIRTQELLAARRIDGAEQYFTRAYDFGYSKTTEEALRIWDKNRILSDVVWVIRRFQPDIIITRFPPDSRAGHGQHSASAVLAREAFDAAGDSSLFPEQFQYGVRPWKARRLIWNTYNFGSSNTTNSDQYRLDVGGFNPLLGKSYGEIASESRSQHKSQGFGVPRQRGQQWEYFTQVAGAGWNTDIMEDVNTGWNRIPVGQPIEQQIRLIEENFKADNPAASLPSLIALYQKIKALPDGYWRDEKLKETHLLIEKVSGLYVEASSPDPYTVQGDSLHIQLTVLNRSKSILQLKEIRLIGVDSVVIREDKPLLQEIIYKNRFDLLLSTTHPLTQPYWLGEEPKGFYDVKNPLKIGQPDADPAFEVSFTCVVEGQIFTFSKPVYYRFTDPVKGELYWPVAVVPKMVVQVEPEVLVVRSSEEKQLDLSIRSFSRIPLSTQTVEIIHQKGYLSSRLNTYTTDSVLSPETDLGVSLKLAGNLSEKTISPFIQEGSNKWNRNLREIRTDHLPRILYTKQSDVRVVKTSIRVNTRRIGYVKGAGDQVPEAILELGYKLVYLEEKDMVSETLKELDVVVTGVRAYNVHPWLTRAYPVLMEFVKNGGVLLVQYNTNSQIGPLRTKMSPFPLNISRNRVTEEDAPVSFLLPEHPVLNYPNKITVDDFKGWVQERSVYEADVFDSSFVSILSMHDTGEPDRKGSLLVADYGKGRFIYTGLSMFRQLPAAVPGAYRLLANLLSGGSAATDKTKNKL